MPRSGEWLLGLATLTGMTLVLGCTVPLAEDPPETTEEPTRGSTSDTEPPPASSTDTGNSSGGTTGAGDTTSMSTDGGPDSGPPPIVLDVGVPDTEGTCPLISVESEPMAVPSDIIIAVDTSGSMSQEATDVQNNLNMFSQQIVDAGVDARVVLIASSPQAFDGICIDPPLGGGVCPAADDNEPLFLHVDQSVGSVNAFDMILSTYPLYQGILRPEAVKQLLIVSDDNSWTPWAQFDMSFLGLDLSHIGYTQHAIVSEWNCPEAASIGSQYIGLALSTGGTIGDLCLQNFQPVFDELALAVIDNSVPCSYDLPNTGGGPQDPSTTEIAVDFGDGPESIPSVDSLDQCTPDLDNWFFDDPNAPTKIFFCPSTCLRLKQSENVSVEITMTCGAG